MEAPVFRKSRRFCMIPRSVGPTGGLFNDQNLITRDLGQSAQAGLWLVWWYRGAPSSRTSAPTDREQQVMQVRDRETWITGMPEYVQQRFTATLFAMFSVLAILLAGVMVLLIVAACTATQRRWRVFRNTHEVEQAEPSDKRRGDRFAVQPCRPRRDCHLSSPALQLTSSSARCPVSTGLPAGKAVGYRQQANDRRRNVECGSGHCHVGMIVGERCHCEGRAESGDDIRIESSGHVSLREVGSHCRGRQASWIQSGEAPESYISPTTNFSLRLRSCTWVRRACSNRMPATIMARMAATPAAV